jgi:hypothetical protein
MFNALVLIAILGIILVVAIIYAFTKSHGPKTRDEKKQATRW